jgi:tRNA(Ile)-lysidine synthase
LKKSQPLLSITYEIFKDWNFSFEQSRQIIGILDSEPGKRIVSETHRLIRDRRWLIISPLAAEEVSHLLIEQDQSQVETAGMHLSLKIVPGRGYKISGDAHTASLDTARITYPLVLRRWRQGDYFYPLGLKKKKKLSRFFIDRKLSLNDKEKVWVLESGGRIIWVVGMRVDDRFKIRPSTREVLRIRMW